MWTFGRKIALGFAATFLVMLIIGTVSYRNIINLAETSYSVAHTHEVLDRLSALLGALKDAETGQRGFVITGNESYLDPYEAAVVVIPNLFRELRSLTIDNTVQQQHIQELMGFSDVKLKELKDTIAMRKTEGAEATVKRIQTGIGKKYMDDARRVVAEMEQVERALLKQRAEEVEAAAGNTRLAVVGGTAFGLILVIVMGTAITRSLTKQIAAAVTHVQQSSAELQAAATQQSAGARESATAMTEITTTMGELLVTSRQIAESAQRVANVAEQTVVVASSGEGTVGRSNDAIEGIRQQVDQIVQHMLDLGRKSQQIGAVLDIVSELAEQTNILAINATIEASVAGESGKRFGVVADEIRKLAERVGGSAKEIRQLIEDIRAAVNTTVMATETGSKVVDAGTRSFGEVAQVFGQINGLIASMTEAAREIQLSTKQQTSAVEQVNVAISNTAQATKETEVSSGQTYQTASQLTSLSKDLMRMVQPDVAA